MTNANPASNLPASSPERAMRITVAYEGEELRVRSRQLVTLRTPPSDGLAVAERQTGFWFQVEDVAERIVYRKVMDSPVRFDTETPSDDPNKPLRRERLARAEGTFFLLVPLSPEAHSVRVFSSPFTPERSTQPARQVLRFSVYADVPGANPQGGLQR